jgi:hypothetical protein
MSAFRGRADVSHGVLSLEAMAQSATTLQRDNVATLHPANVAPKRQLRAAPHMSLYVGKRVQRALKEIALEYDRKAHDILIEAVDMVLQRYGRPTVAELPDDV